MMQKIFIFLVNSNNLIFNLIRKNDNLNDFFELLNFRRRDVMIWRHIYKSC